MRPVLQRLGCVLAIVLTLYLGIGLLIATTIVQQLTLDSGLSPVEWLTAHIDLVLYIIVAWPWVVYSLAASG